MALSLNGTTGISGIDGSASTPAGQGTDTNTGLFYGVDTVSIATNGTAGMQLDSSQNLKFNSGYGSVATAYGCRCWVNFNGTGTVAIRASGNVSSITDVNVGSYTVTFLNASPDANFSTQVTAKETDTTTLTNNGTNAMWYGQTTTSVGIIVCSGPTVAAVDPVLCSVVVVR